MLIGVRGPAFVLVHPMVAYIRRVVVCVPSVWHCLTRPSSIYIFDVGMFLYICLVGEVPGYALASCFGMPPIFQIIDFTLCIAFLLCVRV